MCRSEHKMITNVKKETRHNEELPCTNDVFNVQFVIMFLKFQLCIMYDMHSMDALKRLQFLLFSATSATAVTTFPGTSKIDEKHPHKKPHTVRDLILPNKSVKLIKSHRISAAIFHHLSPTYGPTDDDRCLAAKCTKTLGTD